MQFLPIKLGRRCQEHDLQFTNMRDQAMAQLQRSIKASPTARLTFLTACLAAEDGWHH